MRLTDKRIAELDELQRQVLDTLARTGHRDHAHARHEHLTPHATITQREQWLARYGPSTNIEA